MVEFGCHLLIILLDHVVKGAAFVFLVQNLSIRWFYAVMEVTN